MRKVCPPWVSCAAPCILCTPAASEPVPEASHGCSLCTRRSSAPQAHAASAALHDYLSYVRLREHALGGAVSAPAEVEVRAGARVGQGHRSWRCLGSWDVLQECMGCGLYAAVLVREQYVESVGPEFHEGFDCWKVPVHWPTFGSYHPYTPLPHPPPTTHPPQDDFELQMPTLDEMSNKHGQEAVWLDLAGMGLPPVGAGARCALSAWLRRAAPWNGCA